MKNKLKYDKINILGKCEINQNYAVDMLYNATQTDRVINGKMIRFVNFFFNPKPYGDEERYKDILGRILQKNNYMKDLKIKSIEVNFDYFTDLEFNELEMLGKILADVLSKKGYKRLNINADVKEFDYKENEFQEKFTSYKFFKYKSKNKFMEVKLYRKFDSVNRFEIIFYNVDNRIFKNFEESLLSGEKIKKVFKDIYDSVYNVLENDKELWKDDGIIEFINAFCLALERENIEEVA